MKNLTRIFIILLMMIGLGAGLSNSLFAKCINNIHVSGKDRRECHYAGGGSWYPCRNQKNYFCYRTKDALTKEGKAACDVCGCLQGKHKDEGQDSSTITWPQHR